MTTTGQWDDDDWDHDGDKGKADEEKVTAEEEGAPAHEEEDRNAAFRPRGQVAVCLLEAFVSLAGLPGLWVLSPRRRLFTRVCC